ncbi:MAG: TetR/AcrR family transcriptional regulator [bacterium]|nr:TetR/AcrR family transcriptional regulator [bacterium]
MPKIVDHAQQRIQILNGSFELFARQGYSALTMRQIATAVGISTGALYHYFPTKEGMFEEMFAHMSRAVVAEAVAMLQGDEDSADRLAVLMRYVQANESRLQSMLFLILDYYRYQNPDDATDFSRQIVGFFRQMLAEQIGFDDPDRAAAILSSILGILFHRLLDPAHDFERLLRFAPGVPDDSASDRQTHA